LLLFVTAALLPAAENPGGLSFALRTGTTLTVVKEPRWAAEGQLALPAMLVFSVETASPWGFQLMTGYRYTGPSPAGINEIAYRGHNDFLIGGGTSYRFPSLLKDGVFHLAPRLALNTYAHIAAYLYTSVYFFYPSIELHPSSTILRWYNDYLVLSASLPLRVDFRRDMDYSFSLGLSFDISLYLPEN
jgi:hypothetical protein